MTKGKITQIDDNLSRVSYFIGINRANDRYFATFERGQIGGSAGYVDTIIGTRHDGTQVEWPAWMVEVHTNPAEE